MFVPIMDGENIEKPIYVAVTILLIPLSILLLVASEILSTVSIIAGIKPSWIVDLGTTSGFLILFLSTVYTIDYIIRYYI